MSKKFLILVFKNFQRKLLREKAETYVAYVLDPNASGISNQLFWQVVSILEPFFVFYLKRFLLCFKKFLILVFKFFQRKLLREKAETYQLHVYVLDPNASGISNQLFWQVVSILEPFFVFYLKRFLLCFKKFLILVFKTFQRKLLREKAETYQLCMF